jgi:hypothetical protein
LWGSNHGTIKNLNAQRCGSKEQSAQLSNRCITATGAFYSSLEVRDRGVQTLRFDEEREITTTETTEFK